jgi:ketosteroid isomerase-like protein
MKDTADPQISGHINALIKKYAEAVHNSDAAALAALCTEEAGFL